VSLLLEIFKGHQKLEISNFGSATGYASDRFGDVCFGGGLKGENGSQSTTKTMARDVQPVVGMIFKDISDLG
jgi:hypothetical protein